MTIDITNPEHERALRSAVDHAREPAFAAVSTYCADMAKAADPPVKWAFEALSDPAQAAEIIRALVERAGVSCVAPANLHEAVPPHGAARASVSATVHGAIRASIMWRRRASDEVIGDTIAISEDKRCGIIARLLALAPDAGASAVLEALRGEG